MCAVGMVEMRPSLFVCLQARCLRASLGLATRFGWLAGQNSLGKSCYTEKRLARRGAANILLHIQPTCVTAKICAQSPLQSCWREAGSKTFTLGRGAEGAAHKLEMLATDWSRRSRSPSGACGGGGVCGVCMRAAGGRDRLRAAAGGSLQSGAELATLMVILYIQQLFTRSCPRHTTAAMR
jgi:hypothetical protein